MLALAGADVQASIDIVGTANVQSAGAMMLTSSATANASGTGAVPSVLSSSGDASAAVTTVTSVSTVHVGDSASVSTSGGSAMTLSATNAVTSSAIADAAGASAGASVAVNVVKATTLASIDGAATINSAGALGLSATSTTVATTSAKSSSGGAASAPDPNSEAATYLSDPAYQKDESTTDGQVKAAGAIAISDLTSTTTAQMSSSVTAIAGGLMSLTSDGAAGAGSSADGSNTGGGTGIGAAVALNIAHVANDATLSQNAQSVGLSLIANSTGGTAANTFTTSATSGASGQNVGVAGALATTLLDSESVASVAKGASVAAGGARSLSIRTT